MITKGNDTKVQNEVIAQTITDESAKRLRLARLFPKQEIKENSDYYTYFRQNINLDEAIKIAYEGVKLVDFKDKHFRTDIGVK